MPAVSDKQQHLFQMAYATKKGHKLKGVRNPAIERLARTLSAKKLHEFTVKK